jgi:hypothetical protein
MQNICDLRYDAFTADKVNKIFLGYWPFQTKTMVPEMSYLRFGLSEVRLARVHARATCLAHLFQFFRLLAYY